MSRCRIFPPTERPSPDALAQLRKMPTTIVSDQLERQGVARGIVRMTSRDLGILAGPALTVRTRPGDNLVVYKAVELADPGDVLVVAAGGLEDRAVIGEIFYRHMVARGIGGVVIDGMIRDATEIAAGPVPVFARGATHPGPYKTGPGELRGPVSVGGTIVRNGDAIVGDGDGIAVVPLERVQEVVEGGLALLAKEEQALAQADAGEEELDRLGQVLIETLATFRVDGRIVGRTTGPVVTQFEVAPAPGVKVGRIAALADDLALAMRAQSIRIVAPIPGKAAVGVEVPNPTARMVTLRELIESAEWDRTRGTLPIALGRDLEGKPIIADLAKMPHLLIAGATGSGKSVCINAIVTSLLYRYGPDAVRFIMIDPKMLELSVYEGIPHLLAPVVTDMKQAANALGWCVGEMERRYKVMSTLGVRNLSGFNQKVREAEKAKQPLPDPLTVTQDNPAGTATLQELPLIVVVIDELADLMMVVGKKVEELIARLAQKARAAGVHLILATQRPSVDVITGLIKANIPSRIAFQVSARVDSRTILDQMGAESLLGQGDMLFLPPGSGYPQRVHGAFAADHEVHKVVDYLKKLARPRYLESVLEGPELGEAEEGVLDAPDGESDPLYDQAVAIVLKTRRASISLVQRHLRIGYNRAARLIEQMERSGLVSAMQSNGNRDVLVPASATEER